MSGFHKTGWCEEVRVQRAYVCANVYVRVYVCTG